MLKSALNFAAGFFGIPYEDKYLQSITIEESGYNNTLSPYMTCPNSRDRSKSDRGTAFVKEWAQIYLKDARERLQVELDGFDLKVEDVYTMQQMCAYEVSSIAEGVLSVWRDVLNLTLGLRNGDRRSLSGTPSSANCSRRKNGKDLTTRELMTIYSTF